MITTNRLILEEFSTDDAPFLLELMNDPAWLQFIGDRGVKTIPDAQAYILHNLRPSYAQNSFGFYITRLKEDSTPIGLCGLVKRDNLEDVDIGFAFLPPFRGGGYAYEAASAVLAYATDDLQLKRIVAITDPENINSIKLLKKVGLSYEKNIQWGADGFELNLFALEV